MFNEDECIADLNLLNSQVLPTKKASKQEYVQGENIGFFCPMNRSIASFFVNSNLVCLCYNWDPNDEALALGVFGVAKEISEIDSKLKM